MLVVSMVAGSVIFAAIFVLGASFQFVSVDSAELANSFTLRRSDDDPVPVDGLRQGDRPGSHVRRTACLRQLLPVLYVLG
jgi:ABC-2 type transport system permease protein